MMIKELWNSFPRLIEQHIAGLLDAAEPNADKAFRLYKTCQREGLWPDGFETFNRHLKDFFAQPKSARRKSGFDIHLDRPMGSDVFREFELDFRSAHVNQKSLLEIASWAHHLSRVSRKTECEVISADVFTRTLRRLTQPGPFDKAKNLLFEDFCEAWKAVVFKLFGRRNDQEFQNILRELQWLDRQLKEAQKDAREGAFHPTIYLTQTEIDWTESVRHAARDCAPIPRFPLSRGPQKQRLLDLERSISLYHIVHASRLPELIRHRDNIRATILTLCEALLRDRAS